MACSGKTVSVGDDELGTSGTASGAAGSSANKAFHPPSACSSKGGPVPEFSSAAEAKSYLSGRWLLCTQPSPFGTTDDVGIEFSNGAWYKLYSSGGEIVRGTAYGTYGTWEAFDDDFGPSTGNSFSIVLRSLGAITRVAGVAFPDAPRKLALDIDDEWNATYVPATD